VLLRRDATRSTETPPLSSCSGPSGEPVRVPITGNRSQRILHGAINGKTGDVSLLSTQEWIKATHHGFLSRIRSPWRGGGLVRFADRAGQPMSPESLDWAEELGLAVRLLQGDAGVERDGPPGETDQAGGVGGPGDGHDRDVGPRRLSAPHRPEPARSTPSGRDLVGELLADEVAGLCKDFSPPT
jgi:hypothetical protein